MYRIEPIDYITPGVYCDFVERRWQLFIDGVFIKEFLSPYSAARAIVATEPPLVELLPFEPELKAA